MVKAFLSNVGRYFYDVHTDGGLGFENALILRTNRTDKLREIWMKKEVYIKPQKILRITYRPIAIIPPQGS